MEGPTIRQVWRWHVIDATRTKEPTSRASIRTTERWFLCLIRGLMAGATTFSAGKALETAWSRYADWLVRNDLQYIPANQNVMRAWGNHRFRDTLQKNASTLAPRVATDAEKTQLQTDSASLE